MFTPKNILFWAIIILMIVFFFYAISYLEAKAKEADPFEEEVCIVIGENYQ